MEVIREGIFSLVPELPSSYFSLKTTSGSGDTIRFRNNLISGVRPGSTSLGRTTWAGGCLTAIGIRSYKVHATCIKSAVYHWEGD